MASNAMPAEWRRQSPSGYAAGREDWGWRRSLPDARYVGYASRYARYAGDAGKPGDRNDHSYTVFSGSISAE